MNFNDKTTAQFRNTYQACFGLGTQISTTDGDLPVEWLATGDKVLTRDNGAQPILGIGKHCLRAAEIADNPDRSIVTIPENGLFSGSPSHPTRLDKSHRILMSSWDIELMFGEAEVLVNAGDYFPADYGSEPATDATVYQLWLNNNAVIFANGMWTEMLCPDSIALQEDVKPTDKSSYPCLTREEAVILRAFRDNSQGVNAHGSILQRRNIRVA